MASIPLHLGALEILGCPLIEACKAADCGLEGTAAVVEITRVEVHRFADVPWEFALAEGEGFRDIEHLRDGHRSYYSQEGVVVDDDDIMICVWIQVIEPL